MYGFYAIKNITEVSHDAYVLFDEKQKGISPGQFVAWYKEGILLGSGVIES